jgi:hypothetical protein
MAGIVIAGNNTIFCFKKYMGVLSCHVRNCKLVKMGEMGTHLFKFKVILDYKFNIAIEISKFNL